MSKAKISKIIQYGEFIGSLFSKIAVPLSKNILAPLQIAAAASAIDAGIQKKIHDSGTTFLKIPNDKNKWHNENC